MHLQSWLSSEIASKKWGGWKNGLTYCCFMSRCGPVAEFADWEALNLTQLCFTGLEIVHPRFHNIISIILSLNNLEIHWYSIITHFINRHFFPVWQLNFWSSFQLVCLDIIRSNWNFCVCPLRNGFEAKSKLPECTPSAPPCLSEVPTCACARREQQWQLVQRARTRKPRTRVRSCNALRHRAWLCAALQCNAPH